ncbi:LysR family transcriptional regulator [Salipiger mangrovisoli]|uniref:LysR family transcriptional regulator n=1 Tax=Salipiger mangrovisoli TaxID=2865933 RepID=A0ABR9X1D3_9RHOB|nr:LysR family transcriptional regulator [Salipiger mangrovisoli]MBE9637369.1 LysR family transcriptional regulator [Salipiger mangrovisoli]
MRALDWSLLQSFLRVAAAGSLSAAARRHGVSQPTLGRHVRALEAALEQPLFTRRPEGQVLTAMGHQLLAHARDMEAAAARLSLTAAGASERLEGTVRVTAARVVAHWHLPRLLARLRLEEPGIRIDLVASDVPENLMHREADIALRMFRPERGDLLAQKVAELPLGLYAARSYLDRVGRPQTLKALQALDFVGYGPSDLMQRVMAENGWQPRRETFPLRCEDQLVNWALVCAGCGVGGFQRSIADSDPRVERVADFVRLPVLPVWLVVPEALRHVPRVARVRAALAEEMARIGAAGSAG